MPPDRHRLRERRDVRRQPIRHLERERLLHQQRLGVGAGRGGRQADKVDIATAPQQRQRDHWGALRKALPRLGAVSRDPAGELVAEHDLLTGAHEVVVAGLLQHIGQRVGLVTRV